MRLLSAARGNEEKPYAERMRGARTRIINAGSDAPSSGWRNQAVKAGIHRGERGRMKGNAKQKRGRR